MQDTLHEEECTFLTIFRSVLLKMRNVLEKVVEKLKKNIVFSNFFF